jgi:hypothetical protein
MPDETKPVETNPEAPATAAPASEAPSASDVQNAREILQKAQEVQRKAITEHLQAVRKFVLDYCEQNGVLLTAEAVPQRLPDGRYILGAEPVFTNKK